MTHITLWDGSEIVAEIMPATLRRAIGHTGGKVAVQEHGSMRWRWVRVEEIAEVATEPPPATGSGSRPSPPPARR